MGEYKKINGAEAVIWMTFLFGLYVLNDVMDGVLVGLVVAPLLNWASTAGTWYFFKQKGDATASKPASLIAQIVGGAIPFVPAPVVAFGVKAYLHNHPKNAPVGEMGTETIVKSEA